MLFSALEAAEKATFLTPQLLKRCDFSYFSYWNKKWFLDFRLEPGIIFYLDMFFVCKLAEKYGIFDARKFSRMMSSQESTMWVTRYVTKCGSGDVCHQIKVKSQQKMEIVGNRSFKSCYDLMYDYITSWFGWLFELVTIYYDSNKLLPLMFSVPLPWT